MTMAEHPAAPGNWDETDSGTRRSWLEHIDGCDACRNAWIAQDPVRWFAFLSEQAPPAGLRQGENLVRENRLLEDLTATVIASIPAVGAGRWNPGRLAAAALLAATLLLPFAVWKERTGPADPVAGGAPLADVEILSTPGEARVIDLSVGDTQVVMIFDSELEI